MMGAEPTFIAQYTPALVSFIGAVMIIVFTRNYLFRGMISIDLHQAQILREQQIVTVQEKIATSLVAIAEKQERVSLSLSEMVTHLGNLTAQITEKIDANSARITALENGDKRKEKS